jgi:hypothetical protein
MNKSDQNEMQKEFVLRKALFLPTIQIDEIFNEVLQNV